MQPNIQPIGIMLPISRGTVSGYFNQSYNILDQIKSNIQMLIRTKPGERRMNPSFGSSAWEVLFEGNTQEVEQLIESSIKKDIETWIPYVNVTSVSINNSQSNIDNHIINLNILFTVNSVGITTPQTVNINLQQ